MEPPTRQSSIGDFDEIVANAIVGMLQRCPPGAHPAGFVSAILFVNDETGAREWAVASSSAPDCAGPADALLADAARALEKAAADAPPLPKPE